VVRGSWFVARKASWVIFERRATSYELRRVPLSVSYLLRPERRAYAAGHFGRTAPVAA